MSAILDFLLIVYLYPWFRETLGVDAYVPAFRIVGFLINPILIFGVTYFLGTSIDLRRHLRHVLVSLFSGAWIGLLLGTLAGDVATGFSGWHFFTFDMLVVDFGFSAIRYVFTAFTTLVISQYQQQPLPPPEN